MGRASAFLCRVGFHKWREKPVAEYPMMYGNAVIDGHVCDRCGEHREDWKDVVSGLPDPKGWVKKEDV